MRQRGYLDTDEAEILRERGAILGQTGTSTLACGPRGTVGRGWRTGTGGIIGVGVGLANEAWRLFGPAAGLSDEELRRRRDDRGLVTGR